MQRITTEMLPLTARPEWKALEDHYEKIRGVHLRTLFADDRSRSERHGFGGHREAVSIGDGR